MLQALLYTPLQQIVQEGARASAFRKVVQAVAERNGCVLILRVVGTLFQQVLGFGIFHFTGEDDAGAGEPGVFQ